MALRTWVASLSSSGSFPAQLALSLLMAPVALMGLRTGRRCAGGADLHAAHCAGAASAEFG